MPETNKYILLARHLPTSANEAGLIMGRVMDLPVKSGVDEAYKNNLQKLKPLFKGKTVRFYSSPALRCRQTCEIAISQLMDDPHDSIVDERLNETDCGEFSGKTAKQLRQNYSQLVDTWMWHPQDMVFPQGESYKQVQARALLWLNEVLKENADVIFTVSHVDVIKMLIFGILAVPISHKRRIRIDTGTVTIFSQKEEEVVLVAVNLFGKLM